MNIILLVGAWAKLGGISLEERYLGNFMKMKSTILSTSSGRAFPSKSRRNVKENICETFLQKLEEISV